MTDMTNAYGSRAMQLELTREEDNTLRALDEQSLRNAFVDAREDGVEDQSFPTKLTPPAARVLLQLLDFVSDDVPAPVRESTGALSEAASEVLDRAIATRMTMLSQRVSERHDRDTLLAAGDRHPYYVAFPGRYREVLREAVDSVEVEGLADTPRYRQPQVEAYAGDYADYLSGKRKSRPGVSTFNLTREQAAAIREAMNARRDECRDRIVVTPGQVRKVVLDTRDYRGSGSLERTVRFDTLTARDVAALLDLDPRANDGKYEQLVKDALIAAVEQDATFVDDPQRRYRPARLVQTPGQWSWTGQEIPR